jgi:hypothetical protein
MVESEAENRTKSRVIDMAAFPGYDGFMTRVNGAKQRFVHNYSSPKATLRAFNQIFSFNTQTDLPYALPCTATGNSPEY